MNKFYLGILFLFLLGISVSVNWPRFLLREHLWMLLMDIIYVLCLLFLHQKDYVYFHLPLPFTLVCSLLCTIWRVSVV